MATDAFALISSVLERAAEKYAERVGMSGMDGATLLKEDAVVDLLANQLLNLFGAVAPKPPPAPEPSGEDLTSFFEELANRNHRLASAVGACDCWGEMQDCAICRGMGGPGWLVPERDSFETVVRPALHKLASHRSAVRNSRM